MKTLFIVIALSSCIAVAGRIERDPVTGERVLVPIAQEVLNERRAQNDAREAAEASRLSERKNRRTRIERISDDLATVDGVISNINANANTWPDQKQRYVISEIKTAIRNLRQATEKVRKEIE